MGWRHLAVLARTNAQLALLEEALRAANVPCRVRGGGRLLEQPEVRAWLRDARHRGASPLAPRLADLEAIVSDADDIDGDGDDGTGLTDERRRNLEAVVRLGHEYLALDPAGTTTGFSDWLAATMRTDDIAADTDAVDLVTFHRAKGLEWPVGHRDRPRAWSRADRPGDDARGTKKRRACSTSHSRVPNASCT